MVMGNPERGTSRFPTDCFVDQVDTGIVSKFLLQAMETRCLWFDCDHIAVQMSKAASPVSQIRPDVETQVAGFKEGIVKFGKCLQFAIFPRLPSEVPGHCWRNPPIDELVEVHSFNEKKVPQNPIDVRPGRSVLPETNFLPIRVMRRKHTSVRIGHA